MPESTTSQSPQEVFHSSSEQWSQEIRHNNVQNDTNLMWNAVPTTNVVPLASNVTPGYIPHAVNNGVPVGYNAAPSYINLPNQQPYPRYNHIQHGYPIVGIPNTHTGPAAPVPVLVRPPHRPQAPNPLATQQNIKLIQTAWNKTNGGVKKQKRIRTAFTSQQMMELEQEYARTRYLDRTRRIELADILRLNERTIKIWFQNRRMKEKKDRAENMEDVDDVTTTQSPPEVSAPMYQDQYQPNSEAFNRVGVFVEEYPVSSTSAPMTSEVQMPVSYPGYFEGPPAYDQVFIQGQQYSSPYGPVQEFSPESTPQSESSISVETSASAPSDINDKNWDLSWVKSIKLEED